MRCNALITSDIEFYVLAVVCGYELTCHFPLRSGVPMGSPVPRAPRLAAVAARRGGGASSAERRHGAGPVGRAGQAAHV